MAFAPMVAISVTLSVSALCSGSGSLSFSFYLAIQSHSRKRLLYLDFSHFPDCRERSFAPGAGLPCLGPVHLVGRALDSFLRPTVGTIR